MLIPLITTLLCCAAPPPATIVKPLFFSEIVAESELILIGRAARIECRWEDGATTIRTHVTFADLTAIKGQPGNELTLRFDGGQVGDTAIRVADMPAFATGRRYLLYVKGNGRFVSPVVGFNQGMFEIATRDGREVLRNFRGQELAGIRDDRFVFVDRTTPMPAPHRSPEPVREAAPAVAKVDLTVAPGHPQADELERRLQASRAALARPNLPELPGERGAQAPPRAGQAVAPPPAPTAATPEDPFAAAPILVPPSSDDGQRLGLQGLLDHTTRQR